MELKNKSKRLRKKLFLGEFKVLGFEFSCKIDGNDETGFDAFFDTLIEFIESKELIIGGGGTQDKFEGFITSNVRYQSTTEDERQAVQEWLQAQNNISETSVGNLTDAYYDSE